MIAKTIANNTNGTTVADDLKCANNGWIVFYEDGREQQAIQFSYAKDGCAHFAWNERAQ